MIGKIFCKTHGIQPITQDFVCAVCAKQNWECFGSFDSLYPECDICEKKEGCKKESKGVFSVTSKSFFEIPLKNPTKYCFDLVDVSEYSNQCRKFAKARREKKDYKHYAKRNQQDPEKIEGQDYMGKLAEFCCYKTLSSIFSNLKEPDLSIYHSSNKSFMPDMVGSYKNNILFLSVKSCGDRQINFKRYSWLFQYSNNDGKHGKDTNAFINIQPNNICAFTIMNSETCKGRLISLVKTTNIIPLLLDPIIDKLKGIKKCVYINSLDKHNFIGNTLDEP